MEHLVNTRTHSQVLLGIRPRVHILPEVVLSKAIADAIELLGLPITFVARMSDADLIVVPLLSACWPSPDGNIRREAESAELDDYRQMCGHTTLASQYWLLESLRQGCLLPVEPWVVSFYLHVRTAAEAVADLSVDDEEAMGNVQRLPLVDRIDGNRIIGAPQHVEPDDDSDVKPPIDLLAQALVPSAMTMVRSRSRRPTAPSVIINGRLSDTERTRYRVSISEDSAQSDLQVMGPSSESRMSPSSQPHTSKRRKLHHSTQPDQPDVKIPIDMTMPARPTVPLQQDTTPDVDDDLQITRPAAPNGKKSDKDRFAWPAYSDRSADEKWSIYSYFLDYAQTHLPDDLRDPPDPDDPSYEMDVDTGARVGAVEQVPNELDDEIIQVWAEARRRYTRRNLDHLSIMLSTWATGRRLNLAPMALRAFYDKHKSKIRVLAGPYVPVQARPPGFPWHEEQPVDPEGLIGWIPDWGQPGCAAFTGWDDGQQETD